MSFVPSKLINLATATASAFLFSLAPLSAFAAAPTLRSGMPITFEQNQGQAASDVKFIARGKSGLLFLSPTEIDLRAPGNASKFRLKLRGSNVSASLLGTGERTGVANYFHGKDPSGWITNIPSYSQVTYKNVYPSIDLVVYGNNRQFESDFVIARGADPSVIALQIDGKLNLREDGSLVVESADGAFQLHRPFVYQLASNGERQAVDCHYSINAKKEVTFALGNYDRSKSLVIDPLIDVSTYLGGGVEDAILGIAGDVNANVYVVGQTTSPNFPTTAGSLQPAQISSSPKATSGIPNDPASDCFVAKFSFTGQLIYSTYLGGSALDKCSSVAVNANGEAFVGGTTFSSNFPVKNALYPTITGAQNAFVTHLDSTGSKLIFSTYLGGGGEFLTATALDTNSNVYVAGETNAKGYPTTKGAYQAAYLGTLTNGYYNNSGFLTKLPADGSKLIYSTFLGAAAGDTTINGLAVDFNGSAYVGGETHSVAFPSTPGAYQTSLGQGAGANAFLTKFTTDGTALVYSTFVGGKVFDSGTSVAVDSLGYAYLTGSTKSSGLPVVKPVQSTLQGTESAFALKMNTTGTAPIYYTYLGGSNSATQGAGQGFQTAFGVAVDFFGNAAFVGETTANNFPTLSALQPTYGGGNLDAFVTCFSANGTEIFSTYVGGSGDDYGFAILADPYGYFWLAGQTTSANFPVANAYQPKLAPAVNPAIAILNGFLTRINYTDISPAPTATLSANSLVFGSQNIGTPSASKIITVTNNDPDPLSITGITITGVNPADFTSTNTCVGKAIAASGGTCTITVIFDPSAQGPRTASLVLTGTAPGSTLTVGLSGTGVGGSLASLSPAALAFANQNVGSASASQPVTLKNTGTAPLNISSIALAGTNPSDYTITANTCGTSLAASASCTISVAFKPTATGTRSAQLVISDNAAGSSQTIPLSGTGTAPVVTLSPTSINFGSVRILTSASQTLKISNTGTGPLTIGSIAINPYIGCAFQITATTCGTTLAAGSSCTVTVVYNPLTLFQSTDNLNITDNAAGSPQVVTLTGQPSLF